MFSIVDSPSFGLNLDPSHLVWLQIDYERVVRDYASKLLHVHAKDMEIDRDGLYRNGTVSLGMGWQVPRLPGLGEVRWDRFIAALYRAGYDFVVSIEHEDRAFEATEELVKRGFLIARDALSRSSTEPRSCARSASVREERLEAAGFLLDLAAVRARKRRERLDADAALVDAPAPGDEPVDQERLRDVAVRADHRPAVPLREDAGPIRPGEQHVVPLRKEASRRGSVGVGERRPRDVEELASALVAEAAQRLEALQRAVDLGHVHHAPGSEVAARRGTERPR